MNTSDPLHTVQESVIWSAENLSADDEVGIITFAEIPRVIRPLAKIKDIPIDNFQLTYNGQSNASAALLQAVDILSKKFNTERAIIFFTDGENLLDESKSAIFIENIKAGLRQAEWFKIPVYILSLRTDLNPQNYHSYEWAKEIPINYLDLMTTVRTIIHNDFKTPYLNILAKNSNEKIFPFEVPITAPDHLKFLLLSSSTGTAELQNVPANSTVAKNFVKIFELNTPSTNKFELRADFTQGTGLTLDVVPKVTGILKTEIDTPIFGENVLKVTPVYAKNPNVKIFEDKFFEGKPVAVQLNDKTFTGAINDGVIKISLDGAGDNVFLQKIHFEDLGIVFDGNDTAQLKNSSNKIAWLLALLAISVILILSWLIHRKSYSIASASPLEKVSNEKFLPPVDPFFEKPASTQNFSYNGKLIICATTAEEMTPREFNLFRVTAAQISLSEILQQCNIENFADVAGIVIKPAAQGISLENYSDCTIYKKNELVEKGRRVEILYNDSINITTGESAAELILIFKSLKPN